MEKNNINPTEDYTQQIAYLLETAIRNRNYYDSDNTTQKPDYPDQISYLLENAVRDRQELKSWKS